MNITAQTVAFNAHLPTATIPPSVSYTTSLCLLEDAAAAGHGTRFDAELLLQRGFCAPQQVSPRMQQLMSRRVTTFTSF